MPVHFRVLGPVEAEIDGERVDLGHARQRCVLAVLLVEADRVVPVDVLLDRVWAGRLPRKARVTLSGYVSRLRRLLATGEVGLTREADGYRLAVDPMTVDLYRFRDLLTRARADRDAALFAQALALWRGPAFATLDTLWLSGVRDELAAERLAAELDRNELALAQGQHVALLGELTTRATAHPWDERLAGQLMLALYRCGRQAVRYLEQAVALLADTTDWSGIAAVWDGLGYAHHHVGQYERAVECYEHALRVDHAFGNRYCAAEILTHLGDTHQAAGHLAKARETWQRALDIFDDLDLPEAQEVRAKLRSNPLTRRP